MKVLEEYIWYEKENKKVRCLYKSENSDSDNCDDKETINLLNDIKEKLDTGNSLKSINNEVITNPVNSDKHIYNIANNSTESDGFLQNPSYNDISLKEDGEIEEKGPNVIEKGQI